MNFRMAFVSIILIVSSSGSFAALNNDLNVVIGQNLANFNPFSRDHSS